MSFGDRERGREEDRERERGGERERERERGRMVGRLYWLRGNLIRLRVRKRKCERE